MENTAKKQEDLILQEELESEPLLHAFFISLFRYAIEDPEIILEIIKDCSTDKTKQMWTEVYETIKNYKNDKQTEELLEKDAQSIDWTSLEAAYRAWGEYGWIASGELTVFTFWEKRPCSQIEADRLVLNKITSKKLVQLQETIHKKSQNKKMFSEACQCFENKFYTACATLLVALIDGELIRSHANTASFTKKTGEKASKRIINEALKDKHFALLGYFHLELLNYETVIQHLFEKANGFDNEPNRINRNFLHHGMSKRKVLRKDCIKLMYVYQATLNMV